MLISRKNCINPGKMTRPIHIVLEQRELEKIESLEKSVSEMSKAEIVGNVGHIVCALYMDKKTGKELLQARIYLDPRSSYGIVHRLLGHTRKARTPSEIAKMDYQERAKDLFDKRSKSLDEFRGRWHEIKAFEAGLRGEEIKANRHYLHEREGRDLGLFVAAAHWLKEYSDMFCALAEDHYRQLGVTDFSLLGLERAVVIEAPSIRGNTNLYVFAISQDLACEETAAQYASGLLSLNGKDYETKAFMLRQKLVEAENEVHLCVLGNVGRV